MAKIEIGSDRAYYPRPCALVGTLKRLQILKALKMLLPGAANTYVDLFRDDPGAFIGESLHYLTNFLKKRSLNPAEDGMLG
ncbi:MAG: hypothetical protein ABSE95_18595 [Thermodesulfobacteriota bacterium]|jgi:hypothetical protein